MRKFLALLFVGLLALAPLPAYATWPAPVDLGNNSTTPSSVTSLALTTTATINIGDLVVVGFGMNGSATNATACVDSGGVNTYAMINGSSSSPTTELAWSLATAQVNSGGTITCTGITATSLRKAITAFKVTPTIAPTIDGIAPATVSNTSTTNTLNSGGLTKPQILLVALYNSGGIDPGAFTDSNNFTRGTATPTNVFLWLYYRVSTDISSKTWTPVWTNSVLNRIFLRGWDGNDPAGGGSLLTMGVGQ